MYWIYFLLFIAITFVPVMVRGDSAYFTQEAREVLFIMCLGALGFFLYILKEKSILRHVREKLTLQKTATNISKNLSQSYSYIGEVNRKLEIVTKLMKRLPLMIEEQGKKERLIWEVIDTCKVLNRTEHVAVRCLAPDGHRHEFVEKNSEELFRTIKDDQLLKGEKKYWEQDNIAIMCSEPLKDGRRLCFLLEKTTNDPPDEAVFELLCSLALTLEVLYEEPAL